MKIIEQSSEKLILEVAEKRTQPATYIFLANGTYWVSTFKGGDDAQSNWQLNAGGILMFKHEDMLEYAKFNSSTPEELKWMASVVANWLIEEALL